MVKDHHQQHGECLVLECGVLHTAGSDRFTQGASPAMFPPPPSRSRKPSRINAEKPSCEDIWEEEYKKDYLMHVTGCLLAVREECMSLLADLPSLACPPCSVSFHMQCQRCYIELVDNGP
jgi:hypothetical protein